MEIWMPISLDDVTNYALQLDEAERTRVPIRQISATHADMTLDDGYAIQKAWVDIKLGRGRTIIGHKIGLTSRAMQKSSNITEPDYGALLDDMLFADGDPIPLDRFIEPRIEVELAFFLKRPLAGPEVTLADVLDATDYVRPALELIDMRIDRVDAQTGRTRKAFDTIADNAANAGIILGKDKFAPSSFDLRRVGAWIERNGIIEESGVSAAVLGHPAIGIAWLANKLAPHGIQLEPGQIILCGSFTAPLGGVRGDNFIVDYGALGTISTRFE
ncbi:MAG: 2-oxo-hept-4-ene-1,7-dioate hydratase [Novosphingobium sp.]